MSQPILFRALPQIAIGSVFASLATTAEAVDYIKADNSNNLNLITSWVGAAAAPGNSTSSPDVFIWDSTVSAANTTVNLGNNIGIRTLRILNPGGDVSINGTQTLTVNNTGGVDMSAPGRNLTLGPSTTYRVAASGAGIAQNVSADRVLTYNGQVIVREDGGNVTMTHAGAGKTIYNGLFKPTHVNIAAGEVQFNKADGNSRIGTPTTSVTGARLVINNTSGSATGGGTVTVGNAGVLTGNGLMSSAVTVSSGGTLIPKENDVGGLTAGGLSLAAGSTIKWEGIDTTQADLITVTNPNGLVINGGTVELHEVGGVTPFTGTGTFNLFAYNGAIGGAGVSSLAVAESTKISGQTYTFGVASGFVTLTIEVGSRPQSFWNIDNNGTWATTANWTSNGVPNAVSAIANLGGAEGIPITQPRTVTMGAAATVGVLRIDSAQPFTLAGTGFLTFDDGPAGSTLQVLNGSHTITAPLLLSDNGLSTHIPSATSTLTLGGEINGNGGIGKSGPGTLVLAGEAAYFGTTTVGGGTLQVGNGATGGTLYGTITNSSAVVFNRSDEVTLSHEISGTGSVTFAGTGTTILNTTNTYTGPTTVTAGTIEIRDGMALQDSTLTSSTAGGGVTITDYITAVTLGGLTGDRPFPLTNLIGDPISLTVGKNNSSTSYTASSVDTGSAFTKVGTGTFTLTGSHAFGGASIINGGVLKLDPGSSFTTTGVTLGLAGSKLLVAGGTFNASGSSKITYTSAGFEVTGGTANFSGGITSDANKDSGNILVKVSGGQLNTSSVSLNRGSLNLGAEPAAGQNNQGLYITAGDVHLTGALNIGQGENSSVSTRIDGGTLTVDGALTLGINNASRWSVLDVAGGTLTSTHVAGGILLGGVNAGQVIMHVKGSAVATAQRIQFGQSAAAGRAILKLAGGELYVGAGGMTVGSTDATFAPELRLEGGKLGANADSTSNVPVKINAAAIVTGASSADAPHVMTLAGAATGTGSLTKNGAGTVIFSSASNNFSGPTTVNAGTLGLGGQTSGLVTVNPGTKLAPQGVLSANGGAVIDGTLSLAYDSLATPRVPRVTSTAGTITLGASSALVFSGSGTLAGSIHVLLKASGGVTGTFGSVTGLPPNFNLSYTYDDDGNASTPPVVAIINPSAVTPFDSWIQTYVGSGDIPSNKAGATDDPDGDGVDNLTEFAFDGDPGDGSNNGRIFGLTEDGGDGDVLKQLLLTVAVRTGTSFSAGAPATGSNSDGIAYTIEGSTGLSAFNTGVSIEAAAVPPANPPTLSSGWEWKTFSLDGSNGLGGKGFLRAKATSNTP